MNAYETTLETLRSNECEGLQSMLEAMIDNQGLPMVLSAIGDVCDAKADHIRTNWQDDTLANQWGDLALKVATLARESTNPGGGRIQSRRVKAI